MPNFSPKDYEEIGRQYTAGRTLADIADLYGCSNGPIRAALKKQGIRIRKPYESRAHPPEKIGRIVGLYREGKQLKQIAKILEIPKHTVRSTLIAEGLEIRSGRNYKIRPIDYPEIKSAYAQGATIQDIAASVGCTRSTIRSILRKNVPKNQVAGSPSLLQVVPKKKKSSKQIGLTEDDQKRMVELYESGQTSQKIADAFGCSPSNVFNILRKFDVKKRFTSPVKLSEENYQQIAAFYREGRTSQDIADMFGCSAGRVLQVLHEQGVKTRSPVSGKSSKPSRKTPEPSANEPIRSHLTQQDHDRVAKMYAIGLTSSEIAAEFVCHQRLIETIIRKLGVQPRHQGIDDYSLEDQQHMVRLYEGGMAQDEIAAHFDCGRQTVNLVLRDKEVTFRPMEPLDRFAPRDRQRMVIMHENGHLDTEIAEEFKCDTETVATAIRIAVIRSQQEKTAPVTKESCGPPEQSPAYKELMRRFWQEDNRAVDMILLPEDTRTLVLDRVSDALRYALVTLAGK